MKFRLLFLFSIFLFATGGKAQDNRLTSHVKNAIAMVENKIARKVSNGDYDFSFDVEKNRSISKSFPLDKNDKVLLSNIFGGMTVKIWNKSEIKLDAEIKAFGSSDSEATEQLNNVAITGLKDGDLVSFKTSVAEAKSNKSRKNGNQVKIYYTVYMPATNALTASQQYGNINLPNFAGATSIKVQYGDLNAADLSNANNYLSVQYGKFTVGNVNVATIKHEYGGDLTIQSVNNLTLNSQYAKVIIGSINKEAIIDQQYGGGVTIALVKNLQIKSQYSDVKIGKVVGNVAAKIGYSSFAIETITPESKKLELKSDYGDVTLGFAQNFVADFNLGVNYGNFKYGGSVSGLKNSGNDIGTSKKYSGRIGSGSNNAAVDIKVDYGSVKFN